jgi:hypothetical protein
METELERNDLKLSELSFAKKQLEDTIEDAVFKAIDAFEAHTKVAVIDVAVTVKAPVEKLIWQGKQVVKELPYNVVEVKLDLF